MNALSLFANIGVAEAYLETIGVSVVVANELIAKRAKLYSQIYPNATMIQGDITEKSVYNEIVSQSLKNDVKIVIATPPCQGMSTAGMKDINDERNRLIIPTVNIIKSIKPEYVFLENVPGFMKTSIEVDDKWILIPEFIKKELGKEYIINFYQVDVKNYSVPQTRERTILLLTKRGIQKEWILPDKDKNIVTMQEAIGQLPTVDPFIKDISEEELLSIFPKFYERKEMALSISEWNNPPQHIKRQVIAMMHTPTGKTAFDNVKYYPIKSDGKPVRGYRNTYKRQNWDTTAYTVTMDNVKISSQNNVHPGRFIGFDESGEVLYSDPRVLTLYELMIIMSLPSSWPVPKNTSESFLRRVIGEGIPPLFVKKVFENIIK